MWEEGWWVIQDVAVTPCEGRVSRNPLSALPCQQAPVTPCEGRVSRNFYSMYHRSMLPVTPCEGRVSRNYHASRLPDSLLPSRPARGV